MMIRLSAALLLCAIASPVAAEDVNDNTPCSVLRAAMDSESPNRIHPFAVYILNTLETLDLKHTKAGEPGILAPMTDQGRYGLGAMVSVHCQSAPKMTIYNATAYVYRGIRDMQSELGVLK